METIAKSDIFFFVTTISVGIFTIVGVVIAFYIIKIVRLVAGITERTKQQVDKLSMDIDEVREGVKKEGMRAFKQFNFFKKWFAGFKNNKK